MDPLPSPLSTPYLDGYTGSVPFVLPPVEPVVQPAKQIPAPVLPVSRPETVDVWGAPFSLLSMQQTVQLADAIIGRRIPEYMITANLNYLMLTEQLPKLRDVNRGAAAILADGFPIVRRSRLTDHPLPERVAGADLIVELAGLAAARGYRIYFLGAAPGVAQAAAHALTEQFPALHVAGCYSPPFRPLSEREQSLMLDDIHAAGTDILLVAFGQPKGEFWIHEHLSALKVPLSIQLGASFDFLAGTARRAPRIWQRMGCEWLYRAATDPRRLAPRYAANLAFMTRCIIRDLCTLRAPNNQSARVFP